MRADGHRLGSIGEIWCADHRPSPVRTRWSWTARARHAV